MIQVIDRACTILEHLALHPDTGVGTGDLAALLGVNPPTCANILRSLADRAMVEQRSQRGAWFLGPMVYQLGRPRLAGITELLTAADPLLTEIAEDACASIEIVELQGAMRIHHRRAHPTSELQVNPLFDHKPLLLTGSGRLLLAYMSNENEAIEIAHQQHVRLDGQTGGTTKGSLARCFAAIRKAGRVILHDETANPEVSAGAVPLRWFGKTVLALGWYMPRSRCTEKQLRHLHTILKAAVVSIETASTSLENQQ